MSDIDTLRILQETDVWAAAEKYLKSTMQTEVWREGCWCYFTFAAFYAGERAVAVFSVHLGRKPERASCVFVDGARDRILGVIEPYPRSS